MANGHGGYRAPSRPAAVSGPGKYSRRTDGGPVMDLPDAKYGEAAQFREIQQGAPMSGAGAPNAVSAAPAAVAPPPQMGAPSASPGEPVTAGAAAGPGPGADVLGLPPSSADERADLARRYGKYLPLLIRKADDPSSSQEYRDQVRYLISKISG